METGSILNPQSRKLTKEKMREYLQNKDEFDCVLIIYHAKVRIPHVEMTKSSSNHVIMGS